MFPSWYFILFIIVFDSVKAHSHETTDKIHDVTSKHVSGVAPGNGGKMMLNGKREGEDLDESQSADNESQGGQNSSNQDDLRSSSERDEEINKDTDDDDNSEGDKKDFKTRPLQAGDIFTPAEFLPIAKKLLKKVSTTEGRGIVSSAKSPEELSDKLFRAYFITRRRIVYLTEKDLSGLDALQALSLEGEAVKMRSAGDSITEKPEHFFNLNGQLVGLDTQIARCHYKLIYKKVSPLDSVLRKGQRGGKTKFNKILKLEKKMGPNRHVIINHSGRKSNKETNHLKTRVHAEKNVANEDEDEEVEMVKKDREHKMPIKMTRDKVSKEGIKKVKKLKSMQKLKHRQNKSGRSKDKNLKKQRKPRQKNNKPKFTEKLKHLRNKHIDQNLPITTTQRPVCKWRYICRNPGDLDTCRLHTSCVDGKNNNLMLDTKDVDTEGKQDKDQEELVRHFRKMMGLTALDEEVEKIIEQHVLLVKPESMRPDYRIETLDEYFNKIIMAQHSSTTPGADGSKTSCSPTPHPLGAEDTDTGAEDLTSSTEDLRQLRALDGVKVEEPRTAGNMDKTKVMSTPLSNIRDPQNTHLLSESTTIMTPKIQ